jgi:acyl dehydratase
MLVDHFVPAVSSMGSPGIDELRWLKPVRPGDRLRARVTVVDLRRSSSRPDRGIIHFHQEALNQRDEVVLSMRGMGMYKCRPG